MRGLDDPDNPYREQYGQWDRWLLANAKYPTMEEMQAWRNGSAPQGWTYDRPTVSPEGWLIPQLVELQTLLDQQTDYAAYCARPHCTLSFSAAGTADPLVLAALEQARLALWARMLPPIPGWLSASLPKRAIVLPDGGAVTYGPLGSGAGPVEAGKWRYDAAGNPEVYYRYDANGVEVAHSLPGQPWPELFLPGYTQSILLESSKAGLIPLMLNGFTLLIDSAGAIQSAYDYTGAQVLVESVAHRDGGAVIEVEGEYMAKVAKAQGELRADR